MIFEVPSSPVTLGLPLAFIPGANPSLAQFFLLPPVLCLTEASANLSSSLPRTGKEFQKGGEGLGGFLEVPCLIYLEAQGKSWESHTH